VVADVVVADAYVSPVSRAPVPYLVLPAPVPPFDANCALSLLIRLYIYDINIEGATGSCGSSLDKEEMQNLSTQWSESE
jgi:hypothetical protein